MIIKPILNSVFLANNEHSGNCGNEIARTIRHDFIKQQQQHQNQQTELTQRNQKSCTEFEQPAPLLVRNRFVRNQSINDFIFFAHGAI